MPTISIDQRKVEVPAGTTILQAARQIGLDIPALCYREGCSPNAACMACVVKLQGQPRYVPACATLASEGLCVESETPEVQAVRKAALELLLSDHTGECVATCQNVCPAHLRIPDMLGRAAAGQTQAAARIAIADLVLPAVLGRICPAPCQKGCRRADLDEALAIRSSHAFLGEQALADGIGGAQSIVALRGKVAIVGSGPAGLAAAYTLLNSGIACTIFEQSEQAGGALRHSIPESVLPRRVLDAELNRIVQLGAEIRVRQTLGQTLSLAELQAGFDAVLLATGALAPEQIKQLGLSSEGSAAGWADRQTFATKLAKVFAAGGILGARKLAVRSIGEGKAAARSIVQLLSGAAVMAAAREYTVRCGDLKLERAPGVDAQPGRDLAAPLDSASAVVEAGRCLQCGCLKANACRLRAVAAQLQANPKRHSGSVRPLTPKLVESGVCVESGKCIACGICLQVARRSGAPLGLSFNGRGFLLKVAVPFGESYSGALGEALEQCAKACPTGAISLRPGNQS